METLTFLCQNFFFVLLLYYGVAQLVVFSCYCTSNILHFIFSNIIPRNSYLTFVGGEMWVRLLDHFGSFDCVKQVDSLSSLLFSIRMYKTNFSKIIIRSPKIGLPTSLLSCVFLIFFSKKRKFSLISL